MQVQTNPAPSLWARLRARVPAITGICAVTGWLAFGGLIRWLMNHDSGDPRQWIGGLLFGAAALSFLGCFFGVPLALFDSKRKPRGGRRLLGIGLGFSYLVGSIAIALPFLMG